MRTDGRTDGRGLFTEYLNAEESLHQVSQSFNISCSCGI